ncbi:HNH endonuclease [Arthrobacter agilis]|uniref:HNH endonuclease n=1 Tax=Arthrobacter agilis TaxID=37921 RepID=A0A2L0UDY6_9MICC|nr:HNH endonuclease signature motif containing protein [Arthrobacter agilis]AUZ87439.1 HNH endonuclease [Arthrobacter agilis]
MRNSAEQLRDMGRINDRITSLSAEKARIDAELVDAANELRELLEDRFLQDFPTPKLPPENGRGDSRRRRTNLADTATATEIACLLRISERSAHRLVQHAALLAQHHPRTLTALRTGTITWAHATTLLHEYAGLPAGTAARIEDALLPVASATTVPRLSYRARRLRTQAHPTTLETRARNAVDHRRVDLEPADDAMAWLHIQLPATDAAAIDTRLTTTARALQSPGEHRTLPQLRTDVFTDLLLADCTCPTTEAAEGTIPAGAGAGAGADSATGAGTGAGARSSLGHDGGTGCRLHADGYRVRASINVTVPVLTLLGVDDAPADLEGYGPVPADIARRLAAHAPSFTRLLTHPETGAVLSVGRTTYAVPADLKKWLRVRDRTCRHPGCNVAASRCELDHTQPWSQQGTTTQTNLAHLCRKHHMLKSEGIWHYRQSDAGTLTATSPTGRTYTSEPEPPPF